MLELAKPKALFMHYDARAARQERTNPAKPGDTFELTKVHATYPLGTFLDVGDKLTVASVAGNNVICRRDKTHYTINRSKGRIIHTKT